MRAPVIALLALAAACTGLPFEPAGPDAAPDPSVLGPFSVGVRTVVFEDKRRPKDDGSPRRLVTEIWYPAEPSDGPGAVYELVSLLPDEVKGDFDGIDLGTLETTAVRDAAMNEGDGPYPVVLFSHGNAAVRMQSTFFTVVLASHGYVVMSPDHEGNNLRDFGTLLSEEGNVNVDLSNLLDSLFDRPKDLSFLLERIERGLDEVHVIADLDRVGVSGHSFGAVTSLRTGALESRIDAIVPMAPASHLVSWLDIETPLEELGVPIMLLGGGADTTTEPPMVESIWDHMRAPGSFLQLPTAGHFTFSDFCVFNTEAITAATDYGLGDIIEDGCGDANIDPAEAYRVINNFSIGLFNRYLRDSPGSDAYLTIDRARELTANPRFDTR